MKANETPRLLGQQPRGKKTRNATNAQYSNPRGYRCLLKRENAAKAIRLAPCDETALARLTVAAGLWASGLAQWQQAAHARGLDPLAIQEALVLAQALKPCTAREGE